MDSMRKELLGLVFLVLTLSGCEKKEKAGETEAGQKPKSDQSTVYLSKAGLKNMDLQTEEAKTGSLDQKLKVPGRISPDLNHTAKVSATLEGRILKLNQDLGDKVSAGAEMGLLETPELLDKPLVLKAPIGGMVSGKTGTVGELVSKGQEIYVLSDPRHLWLIGEVKEKDVSFVHAGQKVSFTVLSYPEKIFQGKIARVGNAVEVDSRTFEIRAEVESLDGKLKPGMFADIEVTTEVLRNALLISDAALQTEGDDQIAFVALDSMRFEKRVVKIGHEQGGRVQVLDGIKAGEKVVTEGSFTLKSEMLKSELGEE